MHSYDQPFQLATVYTIALLMLRGPSDNSDRTKGGKLTNLIIAMK